jgi:hypothetical protein
MPRSKIIQILLKDADPSGIKIAQLSVSTAKVFVIPREELSFIETRKELETPALYMLFDDERTSVYIGECENFINRISHHESNKDFWSWVVVAVSTDGLDKADVKFLESYTITKALEIGRFEIQNRTNPHLNNLREFKEESVLDFFDDVELLVNALGFNIFEPIKESLIEDPETEEKLPDISTDIREYDTIVCPSTGNGLQEAFIDKNAWWAVRIAEKNIPKFKYVALYEGSPVSAIQYYAKITKIEEFPNKPGKYIIHHDGNVQKLETPVVLGDTPQLALFGPRYFKLKDIKSSSTMAELTEKAFGGY